MVSPDRLPSRSRLLRPVSFLFGVVLALLAASVRAAPSRPNVLFIAVDDLRPELACYGADYIQSPNIDRLAARGLRFDRAYCQYAICGPTRASLLTGLRPDTLRIEDIDTYFRDTVPDVITLPQWFKAHGYTTLYVGKVFHARQTDDARSWTGHLPPPAGAKPGAGGYQLPENRALVKDRAAAVREKYGPDGMEGMASGPAWEAADRPDSDYIDGLDTDAAIACLRTLKDRPFFLAVGYHRPHLPFIAPKKYFDLYDSADLPLTPFGRPPVDGPAIALHSSFELRTRSNIPVSGPIDPVLSRDLIHAYAACVSFVDAQVGRLLDELDAQGLRDNTIVVLWGDHGWHLGEYGIWGKATDHEVATRVPLLISAPGVTTPGSVSPALVEFVDVYPSLCELAGLPLPAGLEGCSFVPLLGDPDRPWKKAAFSQFPSPALREWAARPLSKAMRETWFGPVIADTEARLRREHGDRYDPDVFENHLMGYTMRTDRYRFTIWVDRRNPGGEPYATELYDHQVDLGETRNVAGRPENRELVGALRRQLLAGWRAALPPHA